MKSLLTFVGNNDKYPFEKPGAIISILAKVKFSRVFLFLNNESYLPAASEINKYCKEKYPDLVVKYIDCPALNPTDYNLVYPAMYTETKRILEKYPEDEFTISITSGTPTMHACWIFLVQGGVIGADIVQVARSGEVFPVTFELDDFPEIQTVTAAKSELTRLARENKGLRDTIKADAVPFIGECPEILAIKKTIQRISKTGVSVLISGQSGTGKEEVAKSIHLLSDRREFPLVTINCGAIPGQLFESELFGHLEGAFTGAIEDKDGLLYTADGGTVFLDEIGELALDQQVKLLRAMEYQKFTPLGATQEIEVNVRFVLATNRDLPQMIQEGSFREDLFYRLAQFEILLPALSVRGNDKLLLAEKFLTDLNNKEGGQKELSRSAKLRIAEYPWPGNIRQLKNAVEAGFLLSDGEITDKELRIVEITTKSSVIAIPDEGIDIDGDIIPQYYQAALKKVGGNAAKAARLLGVKPHTFRARLKNK